MNKNFKDFFKVLIVFILGLVFAWVTSDYFGWIYYYLFIRSGSPDFDILIGLPSAYLLFIFLLLPLFLPKLNRWFYVVLLFPAAWLSLFFGGAVFFPFLFAFLGWGIALGIKKLLPKKFR